MAVDKWTWDGTNPSANQPISASIAFGATAEQTQRAYRALVDKLATSEFDRRVWNDLCGKILDLNIEWCSNNYFTASSPVWVSSSGKRLTAQAMNTAVNSIFTNFNRPWETELRRRDFIKGDIVKGSYFLWMVEAINKWCELRPLFFSFSDDFRLWMAARARVKPSLPIFPEIANYNLQIDPNIRLRPSIPFSVWLTLDGVNDKQPFVVLPSIRISSLMNFYTLNASVNVRKGIVIDVEPKPLNIRYSMIAPAEAQLSLPFAIQMAMAQDGAVEILCRGIIPFTPRLAAAHAADILIRNPAAMGVEMTDDSAFRSMVRIRKHRSVPHSIRAQFYHNGGATFDFDYSKCFDSAGYLSFTDRSGMATMPSTAFENAWMFGFTGTAAFEAATGEKQSHTGAFSLPSRDTLRTAASVSAAVTSGFRPTSTQTLGQAASAARSHIGHIGSRHSATFAQAPADTYAHGGRFKTAYDFAMEFSEEIDFVHEAFSINLHSNQINLEEAVAKAYAHEGSIISRENIGLVCADTLELFGEGHVETPYTAALQTNRACLLSSDAKVYTATDVQLVTTLNTEITTKPQEITAEYEVHLDTVRQHKMAADVGFTTGEAGTLDALRGSILAGEHTSETRSRGEVVTKRAGIMSGEETVTAGSTSTAAVIRPRHVAGRPSIIAADSRSILDLVYPIDDTIGASPNITLTAGAVLTPIQSGAFFEATDTTVTSGSGTMDQSPTAHLAGRNRVTVESSAEAVLVRLEYVLASEIEDELAADLDGRTADEMERRFIFETGG